VVHCLPVRPCTWQVLTAPYGLPTNPWATFVY